jgi:hypothetical protein
MSASAPSDPYAGFVVKLAGLSPVWSYDGPYLRVGGFRASPLVVVQRSSLRIETEKLALVMQPVFEALDAIERATHVLVIDSRAAVGRNEPDFEVTYARYRQRLVAGWSRIAVLVGTIAGQLQLKRHQQDGLAAEVFADSERAVRFLLRGLR